MPADSGGRSDAHCSLPLLPGNCQFHVCSTVRIKEGEWVGDAKVNALPIRFDL